MPYVYSRPYVYSFRPIFQALRLFPALRLFRTLEYFANFKKKSRFLVLAESKHVDDYIRMLDEINESFVFHAQKIRGNFKNSFHIGATLSLLGEPTKLSKSSEAALSMQLRDYKRGVVLDNNTQCHIY